MPINLVRRCNTRGNTIHQLNIQKFHYRITISKLNKNLSNMKFIKIEKRKLGKGLFIPFAKEFGELKGSSIFSNLRGNSLLIGVLFVFLLFFSSNIYGQCASGLNSTTPGFEGGTIPSGITTETFGTGTYLTTAYHDVDGWVLTGWSNPDPFWSFYGDDPSGFRSKLLENTDRAQEGDRFLFIPTSTSQTRCAAGMDYTAGSCLSASEIEEGATYCISFYSAALDLNNLSGSSTEGAQFSLDMGFFSSGSQIYPSNGDITIVSNTGGTVGDLTEVNLLYNSSIELFQDYTTGLNWTYSEVCFTINTMPVGTDKITLWLSTKQSSTGGADQGVVFDNVQVSCTACNCNPVVTRTTTCHDGGTNNDKSDDWFEITLDISVPSGNNYDLTIDDTYYQLLNQSASTLTIIGDGQGGNPWLGTNTWYSFKITDVSDPTCFWKRNIMQYDCSPCPNPQCESVDVLGTTYEPNYVVQYGFSDFDISDGYVSFPHDSSLIDPFNAQLQRFNAREFYAVSGYSIIPLNTGRWVKNGDGNAKILITDSNHPDHTGNTGGTERFLEFHSFGSVPTDYDYFFQADDFAGTDPTTVSDGTITVEYYFCPSTPITTGFNSNNITDPFHVIGFYDAGGVLIFELATDNKDNSTEEVSFYYRSGNTPPGEYVQFATAASATAWDQISIDFNFSSSGSTTVDLTHYDETGAIVNTLTNEPPINGSTSGLSKVNFHQDLGGSKYYYDGASSLQCPVYPLLSICDDGSESVDLTAAAGYSNYIWYNEADTQVGNDQVLSVTSSVPGLSDGSESFYYTATDPNACMVELCCPVSVDAVPCNSCTLNITNVSTGTCDPATNTHTLDVEVTWSDAPTGELIEITTGGTTLTIDPATATSPATVQFTVPADGSTGNAISAAFDGGTCSDTDGDTYDAQSSCENACALTFPFPGFSIDTLDDNCSWLDYDLAANMILIDNGDGTMTIAGDLINGVDADFDACTTNPCGPDDGWQLNITLSDKKTWAEWSTTDLGGGVMGDVKLNAACEGIGLEDNIDYWDAVGTLIGTGCNAGQTISIDGPQAPYRLQIGYGANSNDSDCTQFSLSTWFDLTKNGQSMKGDIYARLDESCYAQPCTDVPDETLVCTGTTAPSSYDLPDASGGSSWSLLYQPSGASASIDGTTGLISPLSIAGEYVAVLSGGSCTDTVHIIQPACDLPCVCYQATTEGYADFSNLGSTVISGPTTGSFSSTIPGHGSMTVDYTLTGGGRTREEPATFSSVDGIAYQALGYTGGTSIQPMYLETGSGTTQTVTFTFATPIADFDFIVFDVDEFDEVTIGATDENDNPITDLSNWIVRGMGDATTTAGGGNPVGTIAPPPTYTPTTGMLTSSDATNHNRSFIAIRPDELISDITVNYTSTSGGNHVYFDIYGALSSASAPCCAPSCTLDISNVITGSCDPATNTHTLDVEVTWTDAPGGEDIEITIDETTLSVSPQPTAGSNGTATVQFTVVSDGSTNNPIAATFSGGTCSDADGDVYDSPASCAASCSCFQHYKATQTSENTTTYDTWIDAINELPDYFVDFEGYNEGDNLNNVSLGPLTFTMINLEGSTITAESDIAGAPPIGSRGSLIADDDFDGDDIQFTFDTPIDYIGFYILDLDNTSYTSTIVVTFTDNSICSFDIDHTDSNCSCEEFVGIVAPPNLQISTISLYPDGGSRYGIDNISYGLNSVCPVSIDNVSVGACSNDQAVVDVTVSWNDVMPSGETIEVTIGSDVQSIDPATVSSPQTLQFTVASDGSMGNPITAEVTGACACSIDTTYDAPAPCPCVLTITDSTAGACNDNGTTSDPSDDTFDVTVNATATNGGASNQFNVTDGTTTWGPFDYGTGGTVTGLPADGSTIMLTFTDVDDNSCSATVDVSQTSCSNICVITITDSTAGACNDNGTTSDPSDDTFDVTVNATATNGGASNQFNVTDGTTTWGPFDYGTGGTVTGLPADGSTITLTFTDVDDNSCVATVDVSQTSCSNTCVITITDSTAGACNDNGTTSDPSDDTFDVTVNATATNGGASNQFNVTDGTTTWGPFDNGTGGTVTGLPADGSTITLTFTDVDDNSCVATVDVSQTSCSGTCVITITDSTAGACNDNGTTSDPSDDTFDVTVNATATNGGASNQFNVTDGTTTWGPFDYGTGGTVTGLPADGSIITLTFTDVDDNSCVATVDVSQTSCSVPSCPPIKCLPVIIIKAD